MIDYNAEGFYRGIINKIKNTVEFRHSTGTTLTINADGSTTIISPYKTVQGMSEFKDTVKFRSNVTVDSGATGFFSSLEGKIITVVKGIVTSIQ